MGVVEQVGHRVRRTASGRSLRRVSKRSRQLKDGHVIVSDRPGSGVVWDEEAVKRYGA